MFKAYFISTFWVLILSLCIFSSGECKSFDLTSDKNISILLNSGAKYLSAFTWSEDRASDNARQGIMQLDSKEKVAPYGDKYSRRLSKLTRNFRTVNGTQLNFKVYLKAEINAFASPDGSIRIYSALMDYMNNDELVFIIGHEMGHIALGHSQKRHQLALTAQATAGLVAITDYNQYMSGDPGKILLAAINSTYSQENEQAADDTGLSILQTSRRNPMAAVSALEKLVAIYGNNRNIVARLLASHPAPGDRARRLRGKISFSR